MQVSLARNHAARVGKALRDPRLVARRLKQPLYHLCDALYYPVAFLAACIRHRGMRKVIVLPDTFDNIGYGYRYSLWRTLLACGARYYHELVADADLAIAWQDETLVDIAPTILAAMREAVPGNAVLNVRCTDIRKSTVGRVHQDVFGYSLEVDPETWTSTMVRKSEVNFRKDGVVIQGPVRREPGYVYQRLVDNEVDGTKTVEYRVPVIGTTIPYALEYCRPISERFGSVARANAFEFRMHTNPQRVFSPPEIAQILALTERLGCDYTELDVVRSRREGRIYVLDCNHTPGLVDNPIMRFRVVHHQSRAFYEAFLRR